MAAVTANLLQLLELETIDLDLYRANTVFEEKYDLYGGQVAAQALRAAGTTVEADRHPHSLHAYFLRPGDPMRPTVFRVSRDRDGRSFSSRRVVALQNGEVILNLICSFQRQHSGLVAHHGEAGEAQDQVTVIPTCAPPELLEVVPMFRLFSFDAAVPQPQPHSDRTSWPTRFWARANLDLGQTPLVHACAVTYLSDISTGVLPARDGSARPGASLDHALWLHGPVNANDWVLCEYHPQVGAGGRGWYTGTIFARDGRAVASLAQETLLR